MYLSELDEERCANKKKTREQKTRIIPSQTNPDKSLPIHQHTHTHSILVRRPNDIVVQRVQNDLVSWLLVTTRRTERHNISCLSRADRINHQSLRFGLVHSIPIGLSPFSTVFKTRGFIQCACASALSDS